MGEKKVETSRPVAALVWGLVATGLVTVGCVLWSDNVVELRGLDWRFRNFSTAPPNSEIVHVDIDDRSLDELGRWPWPRAQVGGIVDVLGQCGARSIILDIEFPLPQTPRLVSPSAELTEPGKIEVLGIEQPVVIYDDALLRESLKRHGRVFVPMHIDFTSPRVPETPPPPQRILTTRPALSYAEMSAELEEVSPNQFRRAKERAIDSRVKELLADNPSLSLTSVRKKVLPQVPDDVTTLERDLVRKGYLRYRGIAELRRFTLSGEQVRSCPERSGTVAPLLVTLAAQGHQSGFVTFEPDSDSIVRQIPLLGIGDGRVYPQFAMAAAIEELAQKHGKPTVTADEQNVTVSFADGYRRIIPIDERGSMLINWIPAKSRPRHIATGAVGDIYRQKQRIQHNKNHVRHLQARWAQKMGHDMLRYFQRADALYLRRTVVEKAREQGLLYDPSNVPTVPTELVKQEQQVEHDLDVQLAEIYDDFYLDGADPEQMRLTFQTRHAITRLLDENEQIKKQITAELARLREIVDGKICIIGSTATGAADFVPTPVDKRTPGVVVHSNIFNTIVSGAFVRTAHPALNILAIVLAGAIVSLVAATRPVLLQGGPVMILLGLVYTLFNALVVFQQWGVWLVLAGPIAAMLGSFLVVSGYRQLTEERVKRHIRGMFAHALSPALVDQLIENPNLARLGGEKRVLSCFFSDLAGFTTLSEQLGEQKTVQLLNRYFDHMTDVIQTQHGGYLNKFLGDGIFAFFGAPIPQEDHARRALAAALDCQDRLRELNKSLKADLPEAANLGCRIGITTGEVMVGNCGSTDRMDYTAIGNPVNLASRLETANKFFGTQILVTEQSLPSRYDDEFLARPLGNILVVGKNEPVSVWNLLGRPEQTSSAQLKAFSDLAHALQLFSQREFAPAADLFQSVLSELPADKPTQIYLDLCKQYIASPPGEDWIGAIQLTEK